MSIRQAKLEGELFSACRAGDVDRVRRAIAAGVDPKKAINKDMYMFPEETPLHTACRYVIDPSPTPIFPAVKYYLNSDCLDLYQCTPTMM